MSSEAVWRRRRTRHGGEISPSESKKKYCNYLIRSFVESRETTNWCPASGCKLVIEISNVSAENYEVSCSCTHSFCWNCGEEPHRLVDCETVVNWIRKYSLESETRMWILVYTKPCLNCKKPIEKNVGCMHMMCRCGHHFCWLYLHPSHSYICNRYEPDKPNTNEETIRKRAKMSLDR